MKKCYKIYIKSRIKIYDNICFNHLDKTQKEDEKYSSSLLFTYI